VPRTLAFLRAINVGGRTVRMDELRRLFAELGLASVETFIASGNVIFESRPGSEAALAKRIEKHLAAHLGFDVATFLRSDREVAEIALRRPFEAAEHARAGAFCVGFLAAAPSATARAELSRLESANDRFHVHGREVYWLCRTGQGESDFSNALFEKKCGVRATFRSMTTVAKLAAKYPPGK